MNTQLKYEISLFTQTVDKVGETTSNTQSFIIENEDLLEARRLTIAKAKELEDECENNPIYVPAYVAATKKYLDYSCFSLTISLHYQNFDGPDKIEIFGGDEELQLEGLVCEAKKLEECGYDFEMTVISTEEEDYEIMIEDLEFLLD